ncbi:MAG: anaerobic ribonucleoside-triphosphate reductase activating protein, partial [Chlorobiales bacterium]|nr:anaerobic ribonucleoside-triphosphate reductase activating protein [Chlorobiales bacterium]
MRIGAFQKFSMIDYPGKLSAIVFTQGCNFRCPYCHNPELVLPELFAPPLDATSIIDFLKTRVRKLDAVVVTGGEPTLHGGLAGFLSTVKALGFLTKLDTNGTNPGGLGELLKQGLLDYVAMDIKSPPEKYAEVAQTSVNAEALQRSIDLIRASRVAFQFRTTVVHPLHSADDIKAIQKWIGSGVPLRLQNFVSGKTLGSAADIRTFSAAQLNVLKASMM